MRLEEKLSEQQHKKIMLMKRRSAEGLERKTAETLSEEHIFMNVFSTEKYVFVAAIFFTALFYFGSLSSHLNF